ncbi:MAG: exopolysaccharide transport family protein [Parvularculaceae bacterium]
MASHGMTQDIREDEELVDLRSVWVGLRRRAALFAAVGATTFMAVVAYAFLSQRLYTAETSLIFEPKTEVFSMGGDVLSRLPADPKIVDTQVELLRSRAMAIRVAQHMRATPSDGAASSAGENTAFLDGVANAAARLSAIAGSADAREAASDPVDVVAATSTPALTGADLSASPIPANSPAQTAAIEKAATAAAIAAIPSEELRRLQKNLEVERVGDTFLIKLRYSDPSPERAALVANTYAEQYISEQVDAQLSALKTANEWLDQRIGELKNQVRHAEEAAAQFRAEQGLLDTKEGSSFTEQRITAMVAELARAKSEQSTAQARFESVSAYVRANAPIESIAEVMSSTVIMDLRRQQSEITRSRAELTVRYGDLHPEIKKINEESQELEAQINREVQRIVDSLRSKVSFASGQVAALERDLQKTQGELALNNSAGVRLLELERDTDASRGVYEALLNRQKELTERDRIAEANARVVAPASAPETPSKPRKAILLAGGLILAFLLASGASFAAETLDTRIKNTHDVRREFGPTAPVVLVPRIQSRLLFRQRQGNEVARKYILDEPDSTFAESMRDLRLHLRTAETDANAGATIVFTSAFRSEGKTTTAFSFATLLADSGRRVAFVDLATGESEFVTVKRWKRDETTPQLSAIDSNKPVEADVRIIDSDEDDVTEVVARPAKTDEHANAIVARQSDQRVPDLVGGRRPRNEAAYALTVGSRKCGVSIIEFSEFEEDRRNDFDMGALGASIDKLRAEHDYIIIDAPAVLARAEASIIAGAADFVVMVLEWCSTTRGAARVSVQRLIDARAKILTFLVNKVDERQRYYFRPEDRQFYYKKKH